MRRVICGLLASLFLAGVVSAARPTTEGKRVIAFGGLPSSAGGVPTPQDMVAHAELLRGLPVDGVVFNLTNVEGYFADAVFAQPAPALARIQPELDAYRWLQRGSGAGNHDFLRLDTASLTADWYDDAAWQVFIANFRWVGGAMGQLGVRGIMLDTEAYQQTPFCYKVQLRRTERDFAGYCAQVRARGRQLSAAVAETVPEVTVMLTFGPSAAWQEREHSSIVENSMGLLPAFARGLQEGAPQGRVIDGYEAAYGYRSYPQFAAARAWMTSRRVNAFPGCSGRPPVGAGFGIWLHRSAGAEGTLDPVEFSHNSHTPAEWEHALHYALLLADSHCWVYAVPWATLPEAYRGAFAAARQPHALGFTPLEREAENRPAAYIVSAKGRLDAPDATVFAPFYRTHEEVYDFPKLWGFRLDPEARGEKAKWFLPTSAPTDWQGIRIDDWWEPQLNRTYLGVAWYRIEFTPPAAWQGRDLLLCFGAVDEDAYVWLNGRPLGSHAYGADGWNTPFEFPLGQALRWDQPNLLVVRVVNQAGVGGIWKSVKIFAPRPPR